MTNKYEPPTTGERMELMADLRSVSRALDAVNADPLSFEAWLKLQHHVHEMGNHTRKVTTRMVKRKAADDEMVV